MMRARRRHHSLPTSFLALLLASASRAAFQNDFSSYPEASQQCLYTASDSSGCDGETVSSMNECLCGNGGNFVLNTASCLAASDKDDLEAVYDTLDTHCSDSGTPLSVSRAKFLDTSPSGTPTQTSPTPETTATSRTNTPTNTPTNTQTNTKTNTPTNSKTNTASGTATKTNSDTATRSATGTKTGTHGPKPTQSGDSPAENEGLSSAARRGIIAGSIIGGLAFLGVVAFFCVLHRRRRHAAREEAHPMLPQKFGGFHGGFGGSEVSGDFADHQKFAQGEQWQTAQGSSWESPYEPPWVYGQTSPATPQQAWSPHPVGDGTGYLAVAGGDPGYPYHHPHGFHELDGSPGVMPPVEMSASPIQTHPPGTERQYSGADWGPPAGQEQQPEGRT